ncbi:MAG: FmdB family zinc ribbon protein [bacterium]
MPTYEYLCDDCEYQFEEFQSITADPLENCPKCGGRVRRLISTGNGLIFKGSGFYITDYKKSNQVSGEKSVKEDKKSSEKKSDGESDVK